MEQAASGLTKMLAASSSDTLRKMLAESILVQTLATQKMHAAEENFEHLALKTKMALADLGVGHHPETKEPALKCGDEWLPLSQVAELRKRFGVVAANAKEPAPKQEPPAEDDRPKYLKDTKLGLGKDELELPFEISVGTDGRVRCMPVAENTGCATYIVDVEDARLEWPMLRGLEGGRATPVGVDPTDPEGERLIDLIKAAKSMELGRLQALGIIDESFVEWFQLERGAVSEAEGGPEELQVSAGESIWLGGSTFVVVASRADFYKSGCAPWAEGNNDFPAVVDGRVDAVSASSIKFH